MHANKQLVNGKHVLPKEDSANQSIEMETDQKTQKSLINL